MSCGKRYKGELIRISVMSTVMSELWPIHSSMLWPHLASHALWLWAGTALTAPIWPICLRRPMLWLIPRAHIRSGKPCMVFPGDTGDCPATRSDDCFEDTNPVSSDIGRIYAASPSPPPSRPDPPSPRQLYVLTANVQTMKDAPCSIFNPSGHAARRQYLLHQVTSIPCDVLCIQEARSRSGRWSTGGWLSWRSGHSKGQYGCEVWIRPDIVQPALTLESWRILTSTPRILVVTCIDPRLPLTVLLGTCTACRET